MTIDREKLAEMLREAGYELLTWDEASDDDLGTHANSEGTTEELFDILVSRDKDAVLQKRDWGWSDESWQNSQTWVFVRAMSSPDAMPELSTNTKPTNPKDAIASVSKAPLISVVPWRAVPARVPLDLADWLSLAMFEGALKYGPFNYRVAGGRASVYFDAADRHLRALTLGEETDPDSGLPHVVKALASLIVLRDCEISGNMVDDRPKEEEESVTGGTWKVGRRLTPAEARLALRIAYHRDAPVYAALDVILDLIFTQAPLPTLTMSEINAHEVRLRKAHEARLARDAALKRTLVRCESSRDRIGNGCGAALEIGTLVYVQTYWYRKPKGCDDGGYWELGEGQFECPLCRHRNRLYDRTEIADLRRLFLACVSTHDEANFCYEQIDEEDADVFRNAVAESRRLNARKEPTK